MSWKPLPAAVAAVVFICSPGMAQVVPALSGKYLLNWNEICQVTGSGQQTGGDTAMQMGILDFNNRTKTATMTGTQVGGSLLTTNGETSGYT
jgi:hypothetical protein